MYRTVWTTTLGLAVLCSGCDALSETSRSGASQYDSKPSSDKKNSTIGGDPKKKLKFEEIDVGDGVILKLVYIPPGAFAMGSKGENIDDESGEFELQHEVEISNGFYMGVYEVTQEEYEKVVGHNRSRHRGPRLPVECVTWREAIGFCKKLSKKIGKIIDLPTEAEWEYCCRAGSETAFHHGNTLTTKQANFAGVNPMFKTAPVGSYAANGFGLYDMHGNVSEWCKDWLEEDYYKNSPKRNPQGPAKGVDRVYRGGSYLDDSVDLRSASRECGASEGMNMPNIGFRVVLRVCEGGASMP